MNYSICLIARNEEETLPRLIGSLKEFQDRGGDIWLLDTGSTDNTANVARELGCEVVEVGDMFVTTIDEELGNKINGKFVMGNDAPIVKVGDRLFDYASARNYIAAFSETDMIATPDCDEIYTKLDLDRIEKEIENGAEQFEYNFVFAHDQYGAETIKFAHSKFYNHRKMKWVGIIHEVLQGEAKKVKLGEDIIKLEHYQNEKTNRTGYLRGLALDCYLHPDNDRNSHYFGRELFYTGRYHSAISELSHHISLNKWVTERAQSMNYMGDAYIALGQVEEGLNWYHKSFLLEPGRREAPIRLARYFYGTKQAQKAACYAAMALQIPWTTFYSNNASHYAEYPHEILYWALWQLGDKEGSKYHFDKALAYQPKSQKYLDDKKYYYGNQLIAGSYPQNRNPIVNIIKKLNPTTILDLGVGTGFYGPLIRGVLPNSKIDGIDIFPAYKNELWDTYNNIVIDDIRTVKIEAYDLYLMVDIIEHMTKEDGLKLLDSLTGKILISTPWAYDQDEVDGNIYQKHLYMWKLEDFSKYKVTDYSNNLSIIILIEK